MVTSVDFSLVGPSKRIIESCLLVCRGEQVLIVHDRDRRGLAEALSTAVKDAGATPVVMELETFCPRPVEKLPEAIGAALEKAQASILIVSADHLEEFEFRRQFVELVERNRLRHAHLVGTTRNSIALGFNVEPERIAELTRSVRVRLMGRSSLHYKTAAGTDLTVKLKPDCKFGEDVGIIRPGRWENLPAGQINTNPEDVNGVYVADASLSVRFAGGTSTQETPVSFTIVNGICTQVECSDELLAAAVETHLHSEENLERIGQVVIGTNPGLSAPIGEPMYDHCVPGVHLVFGYTSPQKTGATWSSTGILAVNAAGGDLTIDGATILRNGRYVL